MKTVIYYVVLIALFVACFLAVTGIETLIEIALDVKLGDTTLQGGVLLSIALFVLLKKFVAKWFGRDEESKNSNNQN